MKSPAYCLLFASMVLSLHVCACHAFQVTPSSCLISSTFRQFSHLHMAKKKRRRRKEKPTPSSSSGDFDDDLPDFDLGDGEEEMSRPTKRTNLDDEITPALMGTEKPLKSVKELIMDRSLEKAFVFDEPENPLPDLQELKSDTSSLPAASVGKKKARARARKVAAVIAEQETNQSSGSLVESASDLLARLPFLNSDREDPALKLVENATWLAIFLLVAWEIYINSPFFQRAAPLAPIVYDSFI